MTAITVFDRIRAAMDESEASGQTVRLRWTAARARVLHRVADDVVTYEDGGLFAEGGADEDGTVYHRWSIALDRKDAP